MGCFNGCMHCGPCLEKQSRVDPINEPCRGDGSGLSKTVRREEAQGRMGKGSQGGRGHRKGGLTGARGTGRDGVPGREESQGEMSQREGGVRKRDGGELTGRNGVTGRGVRGRSGGEASGRVGSQGGRTHWRKEAAGDRGGGRGSSNFPLFSGFNSLNLSDLQEGKGLLPCENSPSTLSLNKHVNQTSKPEGSHPSCVRVSGLAGITLF